MDSQEALGRAVAALHDATLDDTRWAQASALIDEVCGAAGNAIVVSEGFGKNARVGFRAAYYRGERNEELEADYFRHYHHRDERVPRLWQLPDSRLVSIAGLYTEREKRTSAAYNEALRRGGWQNGLNVRMDSPDGVRITWTLADPSQPGDWGSRQTALIERLIPHLRQFVQVRRALARARALSSSLSALLHNGRMGVIQLDRDGRILEVNDRALGILRQGDGLLDRDGVLSAWSPADDTRLQELLSAALAPAGGHAAAGGAMTVRRFGVARKIMLHVNPVAGPALDFGARRVAALVLLSEPAGQPRLDADLVADILGLTAAESQVAVLFSEGMTIPDIAAATGRRAGTVKTLIQRTYRKLGITRQAEMVRLVLSLADSSTLRP